MSITTCEAERLESYITNECSQRIRDQQGSRQAEANTAARLNEPAAQRRDRLFRVIQSQLSGKGAADKGDGKSMSQQKGSRQRDGQSANEPLPAYKKVADAEAYKDCGCVDNTNPVRSFVKRIASRPEYVVDVLGLHIRNPLHVKQDQSETKRPPQKLSKKVDRAAKEARKARKEAASAKKKAIKAKTKAINVQEKALEAKKTIQDARAVTRGAKEEADLAHKAHVGAMRWATSVARDAQGIHEETSNALAGAREFSRKSDYCDHVLA